MGLIQTGLGIASDILGKCGEDKAKAIVDAISDALPKPPCSCARSATAILISIVNITNEPPELRLRGFSVVGLFPRRT